jgi:hypothetical protein
VNETIQIAEEALATVLAPANVAVAARTTQQLTLTNSEVRHHDEANRELVARP